MSNVGHIYVVLLEGGIVKTGKTKNPKSRISKSGFGNREIVEFWVSREFVGYASAEAEMIKFLGCVGSVALGREYFSGVDFSVAVERAAGMLADCGVLVAIAPSSANEKFKIPGFEIEWLGVYDDCFAGTSVSVTMMRVTHEK